MKRNFYLIAAVVAMLFVFSGCSKNGFSGSIVGTWEEYKEITNDYGNPAYNSTWYYGENDWAELAIFDEDGILDYIVTWKGDASHEYYYYEVSDDKLYLKDDRGYEDAFTIITLTDSELVLYEKDEELKYEEWRYYRRIK